MKTLFFGALAVLAGMGASRLSLPTTPSSDPALVPIVAATASRPRPPERSISLTGDWKPAARQWAEENPAEFCAWLVKRGIPPGSEVLELLFSAWVRQDPDGAFAAALDLPKDYRGSFGSNILNHLTSEVLRQPGGLRYALQWGKGRGGHGLQMKPEELAKQGPPEEVAQWLAEGCDGTFDSGQLLETFAKSWATQDPAKATAWAKSLRPEIRDSALNGILQSWSVRDPAGVLDYLASSASTAERWAAFYPLQELAKTDPEAALAWFERHVGGSSLDSNHLNSVFGQWGKNDFSAAQRYALELDDPRLRRQSLEALFGGAKPAQVLASFTAMPRNLDGKADRNAFALAMASGGFSQWWNKDKSSATALSQMISQGDPADIPPKLAQSFARDYYMHNQAKALAWLREISPALLEPCLIGAFQNCDPTYNAREIAQWPESPARTKAQEVLRQLHRPKF